MQQPLITSCRSGADVRLISIHFRAGRRRCLRRDRIALQTRTNSEQTTDPKNNHESTIRTQRLVPLSFPFPLFILYWMRFLLGPSIQFKAKPNPNLPKPLLQNASLSFSWLAFAAGRLSTLTQIQCSNRHSILFDFCLALVL